MKCRDIHGTTSDVLAFFGQDHIISKSSTTEPAMVHMFERCD